jgi:glycosyltransferase involved in cell wall biosynthesis
MKICFGTYPTAMQQPGGGEAVLEELKQALEQDGVEVGLFNTWETRLTDFDVFHYFSSVGTDLFPHLRAHLPLVVTPTIWPDLPPGARARRRLRQLLGREAAPYAPANRVIAHSETEARLLVRNYGVRSDQIAVVPHGVDERFFLPASGEFAEAHRLESYVLCAGRIEPNKNQLAVIDAMSGSAETLVVLGDVMAGAETYGAACRAAAGPNTVFVPRLPSDSELLRDAIAGAACVVVPSFYEIWSLVAHEAAVAGVPIACTKTPPMPELLGDFAVYLDPRSSGDIRRAVDAARARGRLESQAAHFSERISWPAVASRMREIYASIEAPA